MIELTNETNKEIVIDELTISELESVNGGCDCGKNCACVWCPPDPVTM